MKMIKQRFRTEYEGFTIEYYQEVDERWTGIVVETLDTEDVIARSALDEATVLGRVKKSIDERLASDEGVKTNYAHAIQKWLSR